tara:strand:- start:71 stop:994 length:924 start_codon:yes stop_codon:yes gene_type:complete
MQEIHTNQAQSNADEINIKDLFSIIWNKKIFIGGITLFVAILSILYSLSLPNVYTSQSLLAPSSQEDSLSSKLGSLSSIASFGGFSMQSDSGSKSQEAIERIKSFEFFSTHFLPNIKLENIMATKGWDYEDKILIYNKDKFNQITNEWVRSMPSAQKAFKVYKAIMSVSVDKKTSFIKISIDHHSPVIAKKWIDIIIFQINESMRRYDAEASKKAISFLNETAGSTNVQSLREAITKLLENQMQILMLTTSNEYYVMKIIDSSIVPEEKSKPSRALICILATLLGGMISVIFVLIQHYYKKASKPIY